MGAFALRSSIFLHCLFHHFRHHHDLKFQDLWHRYHWPPQPLEKPLLYTAEQLELVTQSPSKLQWPCSSLAPRRIPGLGVARICPIMAPRAWPPAPACCVFLLRYCMVYHPSREQLSSQELQKNCYVVGLLPAGSSQASRSTSQGRSEKKDDNLPSLQDMRTLTHVYTPSHCQHVEVVAEKIH